jgi:metal-dependent amidase/aminoacylase/carboxypeptidase family protein
VLLFQPAEETGEGAARVIADPQYPSIAPDFVFALHNLPGFELGSVILRDEFFASASQGLIIELQGASSHAAEPHLGCSPALAVASLIQSLSASPQIHTGLHEAAQVTIVHARVGDVAFGTSPGYGVVMATLRTHAPGVMESLASRCLDLAQGIGRAHGLGITCRWTEEFPATVNDSRAVVHVRSAASACLLPVIEAAVPFPWSEDFGHFTSRHPGALFGLGSGTDHPPLHHPAYDFPDELLPTGVRLLVRVIHEALGDTASLGDQPG